MNRIRIALGVFLVLTAIDGIAGKTEGADKYPDYYAARDALERGDCEAGILHLDAYLRSHPYIPERYPDHYREIRFVMDQCRGGVKVRGVGDESGEIDPLPDHPPMVD